MTRKKTPWQRIRDASERGSGVRLSADDVGQLAFDGAIMTRAELDDELEIEPDYEHKEKRLGQRD